MPASCFRSCSGANCVSTPLTRLRKTIARPKYRESGLWPGDCLKFKFIIRIYLRNPRIGCGWASWRPLPDFRRDTWWFVGSGCLASELKGWIYRIEADSRRYWCPPVICGVASYLTHVLLIKQFWGYWPGCLRGAFVQPRHLIFPARQTFRETPWNPASKGMIIWPDNISSPYTAGIRVSSVAEQVGARCQTFAIIRDDSSAPVVWQAG